MFFIYLCYSILNVAFFTVVCHHKINSSNICVVRSSGCVCGGGWQELSSYGDSEKLHG